MPRCDLQVISCHSNRPSEWVLRKLGVPQSYSKPAAIYESLKKKGCNFVTITDHNTIDGCLEIAERRDAFISEKVTTYFPEDGCKIHLLVWDITPGQHEQISEARQNIYELSEYLRSESIYHGVAHPLFSINQRLTAEHFERLVLLFRLFESLNGGRDALSQEIAHLCLTQLTKEKVEQLANKHGIQPSHKEPWKKSFFGSSDDISGLYMGRTYTEVQEAATVEDFLRKVQAGKAKVEGESGDALKLSNSIYNVVFAFASDKLSLTAPKGLSLIKKVAERFLEGKNPTHLSVSEYVGHITEAVMSGKALDLLKPDEPSLNKELVRYFMDQKSQQGFDEIIRREPTPERRSFCMASKIANDLIYRLFLRSLDQVQKGQFVESLQPLTGMLPIAAGVSPYLFSYYNMHGNRPLLKEVANRFCDEQPPSLKNEKRAWFTDTLQDVNGVARTIRTMTKSGIKAGEDIVVVTSASHLTIDDIPIKNFEPVGEFEMPEYKLQKVAFPPLLDLIDYVEREGFTELIISTPGPVGLTALAAAKLLGLRTSGIYHTDFPQYVRILTEDEALETVMWSFMQWFYAQVDLVYVNSTFYKDCWVQRGIPAERLEILPRGLDTDLFHSDRRQSDFWQKFLEKEGRDPSEVKGPVMIYVGRVSREKDLPFLVKVCKELKNRGVDFTLAVVGDGPYREEMSEQFPEGIFTGVLSGEELATAYASADLFAFPSTTDTFGNVVIEAMACGLPVMVSDIGGPCELVTEPERGQVTKANDLKAWSDAMQAKLQAMPSREEVEAMAARVREERSWDQAFKVFWKHGLEKNDKER